MPLNLTPTVADYLRAHRVMTLATCGPDGPWAAAVFFAPVDDDLVFLSMHTSRHGRNLAMDARCAATIQSEASEWRGIKGIQVEGCVSELQGHELNRCRGHYVERFPFVGAVNAAPAILQALARIRWYSLRIARLYFIDNDRGFGKRQMFEA